MKKVRNSLTWFSQKREASRNFRPRVLEVSVTVPSAIEYILVTSAWREGRRNRKGYVSDEEGWSVHPSEPYRVPRSWRAQAQLNYHWSW